MHRHSPLMRSLLSQSQAPTSPRRAVGFFGSGRSVGYPAELITQSNSDWPILFEPILSIVDGAKVKRLVDHCQCPFSVQCRTTAGLHPGKCTPLKRARLLNLASTCSRFCTKSCTTPWKSCQCYKGELIKQLDCGNNLTHVGCSRRTRCPIS
jgi:hypothetical protein